MTKTKFSYFTLYLKRQLIDEGDVRYRDTEWLNERGDAAAAQFEASRRQGLTVEGAMEMAYKVLLDGVFTEKETPQPGSG